MRLEKNVYAEGGQKRSSFRSSSFEDRHEQLSILADFRSDLVLQPSFVQIDQDISPNVNA